MFFLGGGAVGFLPLAVFLTNKQRRYSRNRDDKFMQILLNANTMFIYFSSTQISACFTLPLSVFALPVSVFLFLLSADCFMYHNVAHNTCPCFYCVLDDFSQEQVNHVWRLFPAHIWGYQTIEINANPNDGMTNPKDLQSLNKWTT